ncbi:MAG: hypothetical protein AAFQ12_14270 [Pseudomonadota bacterium]
MTTGSTAIDNVLTRRERLAGTPAAPALRSVPLDSPAQPGADRAAQRITPGSLFVRAMPRELFHRMNNVPGAQMAQRYVDDNVPFPGSCHEMEWCLGDSADTPITVYVSISHDSYAEEGWDFEIVGGSNDFAWFNVQFLKERVRDWQDLSDHATDFARGVIYA